jgi:site-specific DNA recombinase
MCKCCDAPFTPNHTKKKSRIYRYYTCHRKRSEGASACASPNLPAGEIENLVVEQLFTIGSNKDLQDSVYAQLKSLVAEKTTKQSQEKSNARQQLDRINRELTTSRDLEAPISLIRHLELKQQEAESLLEVNDGNPIKLPKKSQVAATLRNIQSLWPSFTPNEKCLFVRSLLKRVDYDSEAGKVTLHFSENGFLPQPKEDVA